MNKVIRFVSVVCLMLVFFSKAALALTTTGVPTACANVTGIGTQSWSNTGNAFATDNNYATASVNDNQITNYLRCTGFGFSLPVDATINGVTVNVERKSSSTITEDAAMRLVRAGAIEATDRSTTTDYTTTDVVESHGGATDLWGAAWTATDINNTNFGAAFAAMKNGTNTGARTVSVDQISIVVTYTLAPPPVVSSIVRANTNPVDTGTSAAWTVTFSKAVTGVNAADFALVSSLGVSGASITSVTGSGTTWTVTANTGSGNGGGDLGLNLIDDDSIVDSANGKLGGTGTGNGSYTGEVYMVSPPCVAPPGAPAGVTCKCDNFNRAILDGSTIYGADWIASKSDSTIYVPRIVNPGYLRLTDNTGGNAKSATVPGIFPAAGNYISVEYRLFAYSGSSADGIAVTLSDYNVSPVPGAFGGSLGYAQKSNPGSDCAKAGGCPGFAGGWIGVALDEFGNFQNPSEGRIGGPGARAQSVAIRASGSGQTGYNWLAGTAAGLTPAIDNAASTTPAPGHRYQVIVDARNDPASTAVAVNRDTGSGTYGSLLSLPNVYATATGLGFTQAPVPQNWYISFTGSTGGSANIHEIGSVRICATTFFPPSGGVANGFSAIDEAYGASPEYLDFAIGRIYTKLVGVPFKLNVAALKDNQILNYYYVGSGSKSVTVKLVDNSDAVCVLDKSLPNACSAACKAKPAVVGGTQVMAFTQADAGKKLSANFTVNTAYKNLAAIITDDATPTPTSACSTDAFAVRPLSFTPVVITPTNVGQTVFKAGTDPFTMTVTTNGVAGSPSGYTGVPKVNNAAIIGTTVAGSISGAFSAATTGTPSSTATGNNFKYSEVGSFTLPGYNPATDGANKRGVYDGVYLVECGTNCDQLKATTSWTGVDSISTKNDCVDENYSNTKNASGKYGCLIGTTASTSFGRFVPDHFALSNVSLTNRSDLTCPTSPFTYMGEPIKATFTLTAQNGTGGTTQNYTGAPATLGLSDTATNRTNMKLGALDSYSSTTPRIIAAITKANPGVVTTSAAHGYANTDKVYINNVTGMAEVNNQAYTVTVIDATRFSIGGSTAGYGTYVGGGMAWKKAASGTDLSSRVSVDSLSGIWGSGATAGVASGVQMVFRLNRKADNTTDGPLMPEFGISPTDSDGVSVPFDMDIVTPTGNDHGSIGLTQTLFGRMKLSNAYGSDKLDLPIPMRAEYWNSASGMFVPSVTDNCTPIDCKNVNLLNYRGGVTAANMPTANILLGNSCDSPITLNAGVGSLKLLRPAAAVSSKGSVEVCVDLGVDASNVCSRTSANQTWLQGKWRGSAGNNDDPWCRASFGVYKKASEFIYFREMY